MITNDDDFPYYSDDPDLKPIQPVLSTPEADRRDEQEIRMLLRFMIGSSIEGSDEFMRRARLWQAELKSSHPSSMVISPTDETDADRIRYALLGMMFQALDFWSDRLESLQQNSSQAYQTLSRWFDPLMNNPLMRPARDNIDNLVALGESLIELWINIGRREEQLSRSLVRDQAYDDMVDDVLDYLAQKPEVRDLVQQQSVSMAGEFIGDFRERSTDVDTILADKANAILRRQPKDTPPTPGA
jgi:hypothetical protein